MLSANFMRINKVEFIELTNFNHKYTKIKYQSSDVKINNILSKKQAQGSFKLRDIKSE